MLQDYLVLDKHGAMHIKTIEYKLGYVVSLSWHLGCAHARNKKTLPFMLWHNTYTMNSQDLPDDATKVC